MSARVILRGDATEDLERILGYLAERNTSAADRFARGLEDTLNELAAMPGKGSLKPMRDSRLSDLRSWSMPHFRNYLILYRPLAEGIEVLAIVHGARNLPEFLEDRI